jgi:hypothetical protein
MNKEQKLLWYRERWKQRDVERLQALLSRLTMYNCDRKTKFVTVKGLFFTEHQSAREAILHGKLDAEYYVVNRFVRRLFPTSHDILLDIAWRGEPHE